MDRPAYDPNAQRLERQDQEHEIKIISKRTKDDKKFCQKIAKRIIELKFDWTLPEIFAIVNFGCLSL